LNILPEAAADPGLDIARNLNAFYRISGIDIEFSGLEDGVLISSP